MKIAAFCAIVLILLAMPAFAELPDYVLDRDYQNCLGTGGGGGAPDPERAAYCMCIRNAMKNWDEDTYMNVAGQAAATASGGAKQTPGQLEDIARQCIAQVLH